MNGWLLDAGNLILETGKDGKAGKTARGTGRLGVQKEGEKIRI